MTANASRRPLPVLRAQAISVAKGATKRYTAAFTRQAMQVRPRQALAAQRDKPLSRVTGVRSGDEFSFNNRAVSGPHSSAGLIMAYSGKLFVRSTVKNPSADPLLTWVW